MPEPVIVLHGVNTRSQRGFEEKVARLNTLVPDTWQFIPVFWGDITPKYDDDFFAFVQNNGEEHREPSSQTTSELSPADREDAILRGFRRTGIETLTREQSTSNAAPPADISIHEDTVRAVVREALPRTRFLQHISDQETLDAVGTKIAQAVIQPLPASGASDRDVSPSAEDIERALMSADDFWESAVGNILNLGNTWIRKKLSPWIARSFGDLIVYSQNETCIQQRVWDALAAWKARDERNLDYGVVGRPVNVIAHSLGGVIAFDMATLPSQSDRLWISNLVTFGSQAAFVHTLDPRQGLDEISWGDPVVLPETIQTWTNLWKAIDAMAFRAGTVFQLHDGSTPRDIHVTSEIQSLLGGDDDRPHDAYWDSDELAEVLTNVFGTRE